MHTYSQSTVKACSTGNENEPSAAAYHGNVVLEPTQHHCITQDSAAVTLYIHCTGNTHQGFIGWGGGGGLVVEGATELKLVPFRSS